MLEKREWRRIDVKLPAKARSIVHPKGLKVEIININPQGFCFFADKGFAKGDELELDMDLPGAGVARLLTEVVWSGFLKKEKYYATGVRVIGTDPEENDKFLKVYNVRLVQAVGNG